MSVRLLLMASSLLAAGCHSGFQTKTQATRAATVGSAPDRLQPAAASPSIPEGPACLTMLGSMGVAYRPLAAKQGIETPVEVQGPLAGVSYRSWGNIPLVMSCRLAVALTWVGPILTAHGVTGTRHSGAYVYRTSRKTGRLSLHAHGLAIDLHTFSFADGATRSVKLDYESGQTDPCAAPVLNHLACSLGKTGLFRELLTPDRDADHHDHFHLAIAPTSQPERTPPPMLARRQAHPAKHRHVQGR